MTTEAVKKFAEAAKSAGSDEPMTPEKLTEGYILMTGIIALMSQKFEQQAADIKVISGVLSAVVDMQRESMGLEPLNLPAIE